MEPVTCFFNQENIAPVMGFHICDYLASAVTTVLLADSPIFMHSFASFDEVSHNMERPTWFKKKKS